MSGLDRRFAVAVALAVTVALGGVALPVAAGSHGAGTNDDGDGQASENDGIGVLGNSTVAVEGGVDSPRGGGFVDVECYGTPTDHECDKDGGLRSGPVTVDYYGNNSDDFLELRGGGGDTVAVTVDNRTRAVGFDCEFTPGTVANGTACEAGTYAD